MMIIKLMMLSFKSFLLLLMFSSNVSATNPSCDNTQVPTYVLGDYQTGLQCLNLENSTGFFCQRLDMEGESAELIDDFHYFIRIENDIYEFSDFQQYDDTFLIARKARVHMRPTMMTFLSDHMIGDIHREHMILMLTYRGIDENLPTIFGRCALEDPNLMIDTLQQKLANDKSGNQF
jgi:hypothetical protein